MKKILAFCGVLLVFFAFACSADPKEDPILINSENFVPAPEDFYIRWNYDGGMAPESEKIYISKDKSYIEETGYKGDDYVRWITPFSVTDAELAHFYDLQLKERFKDIKTFTEEVHDRGGENIRIRYDGNTVSKSDSGQSFIADKDSAYRFNLLSKEIEDFADKKTVHKNQELFVQINDVQQVQNITDDVTVFLDDQFVTDDWYFRDGSFYLKTSKGKHEFKVSAKILVVNEQTGPAGKFEEVMVMEKLNVPWTKRLKIVIDGTNLELQKL